MNGLRLWALNGHADGAQPGLAEARLQVPTRLDAGALRGEKRAGTSGATLDAMAERPGGRLVQ